MVNQGWLVCALTNYAFAVYALEQIGNPYKVATLRFTHNGPDQAVIVVKDKDRWSGGKGRNSLLPQLQGEYGVGKP